MLLGFVLVFCYFGYSKLFIVVWVVYNQFLLWEMVDWILCSWVLQFGFLVIIFWCFVFMGKLSSDRLMQIVGIFNDVCYLVMLVLVGILLCDGWCDFQGVVVLVGNICILLIFVLSFYLLFQLVWILFSVQQYELLLWGWLLLVLVMVGVLLVRLMVVGIVLCFWCWLGMQGCLCWCGLLVLFSGLMVFCIGGNVVICQIFNMIK